MRAVIVRQPGPAETLELGELPLPEAAPGRVVVRVEAAGINPVDAQSRSDPRWAGIDPPYVVGYELAGTVQEVGTGVTGFAPGDRVWGVCPVRGTRWGTYAEYAELDAAWIGRRPAGLEPTEAAAIPLAGSTALQLLDRLALPEGASLLVHGAAGGVGHLLVQLARANRVRVAGSASAGRHALLRELGVEIALDRELEDVVGAGARLLGAPFDAVADLVGQGLLSRSLTGVREGGSAATIVELTGDFEEAIDRNIDLHGVLMRPRRETLDRLAAAVERGELRPVVDQVVGPDGIVQAHRRIETGHGSGKLVLRMGDGEGRT